MKTLDSTQLLPQPTWTDPRLHLLDDLWLLAIFAILLAAGLPWLISSFDIQFGAALLGLLALARVYRVRCGEDERSLVFSGDEPHRGV